MEFSKRKNLQESARNLAGILQEWGSQGPKLGISGAQAGISAAKAGDFSMGQGRGGAWLQQKSQGCITIGHFGSHAHPSLTLQPVEVGGGPTAASGSWGGSDWYLGSTPGPNKAVRRVGSGLKEARKVMTNPPMI